MKLLVVVSSLDLTQPFSATPAWWQLLKALYEIGVDVIAAPYQGKPIESLWWRQSVNPAKWQGDLFKWLRDTSRRVLPSNPNAAPTNHESTLDKLVRRSAQSLIAPLWHRHLDQVLTKQPDIDAVLFLTIPLNHLAGVPAALQAKHHKPFFYFDGDVPASLPTMKGFASGFRIYQGADLSEYAAFISNSTRGSQMLLDMGARAAHTVWYGADPDVFSPLPVPQQDIDVMFYGHGREYRGEWIDAMLRQPSLALSDADFRVRGLNLGDIGRVQPLPYLSFSKLREYACRSKLNLCITRGAHASVHGSSSSRPFELAAMGACIVANPYDGLEMWFEPDKEVFIVHSAEEATDRYRYLLTHEAERRAAGERARARLLAEHTFQHRAQQLVTILQGYL